MHNFLSNDSFLIFVPYYTPNINRSLPPDMWTPVSYTMIFHITFLAVRHVNPVRRIFALFKLSHDKLNPTYLFPSLSRSLLIDTPKISIKKNSPAQYPLDPQLLHKSVIQLASSSSSSPSLNHDQEENRENWDGSIQRDVSIKPDPDR